MAPLVLVLHASNKQFDEISVNKNITKFDEIFARNISQETVSSKMKKISWNVRIDFWVWVRSSFLLTLIFTIISIKGKKLVTSISQDWKGLSKNKFNTFLLILLFYTDVNIHYPRNGGIYIIWKVAKFEKLNI